MDAEVKHKLTKVYKAIDLIREESQYSGWREIADQIETEVKELEHLLKQK